MHKYFFYILYIFTPNYYNIISNNFTILGGEGKTFFCLGFSAVFQRFLLFEPRLIIRRLHSKMI